MNLDQLQKLLTHNRPYPGMARLLDCSLPKGDQESLSEEQPQIRRADWVWLVKGDIHKKEADHIILVEFLTKWDRRKLYRLLCYWAYLREKHPKRKLKTYVILLRKSGQADHCFRDEGLLYEFELIKLYEYEAEEYLDLHVGVLPFVVLMNDGMRYLDHVEKRIVMEAEGEAECSDLLAVLYRFADWKQAGKGGELFKRKRSSLMGTTMYEMILEEGIEQGEKIGKEKGEKIGKEKGEKIGKEKGEKIGERRGVLLTIRNLLSQKVSWQVITAATGVSRSEYELQLEFVQSGLD